MAKLAKPVPEATEASAKPKSSKKVFLILAVVVVVAAVAAGWFFTRSKGAEPEAAKAAAKPAAEPKFIAMEPFTVNLQKEETDQFLQIGITLKVTDPDLEDKIKQHMPEIRSHLLLLLSSKRASDLTTGDGKVKLAQEIIAEVGNTLGLASSTPAPAQTAAASGAASGVAAASAPAAAAPAKPGNIDVLFTSFIIQ